MAHTHSIPPGIYNLNGPTHLTDDLPLHHQPHRHMQPEQLPLHLELQVILRRLPLQVTTSLVSGRWMRARRRRLTFSNLSRILLVDVISAARLRGPCLSVSWRPKLLVVSWTVAALSPLPGTMRRESCGHVGFNLILLDIHAQQILTMMWSYREVMEGSKGRRSIGALRRVCDASVTSAFGSHT